MRILIIGATHGNESLGVRLYQRLLQRRSPLLEHVDFIIGNPRAYAARKRYIERDLNRSYRTESGPEYEYKRAQEIKEYIKKTQPDLVLDMHTTTCEQPTCLIVASLTGRVKRRFLRNCHIDTVLQVKPLGDILSLGDNVVAYEVSHRLITVKLLEAIIDDLQKFLDNISSRNHKKLYRMEDKIYKSDVTNEQAKTFVNFEMHPLGFVPIMTGENSYKRQTDYLGFKASAAEEITL